MIVCELIVCKQVYDQGRHALLPLPPLPQGERCSPFPTLVTSLLIHSLTYPSVTYPFPTLVTSLPIPSLTYPGR